MRLRDDHAKRHFELIASVINTEITSIPLSCTAIEAEAWKLALKTTALTFARELRRTNQAFNRDKFLKACGI